MRIPKKRRIERKTNYSKRLKLLKGNLPRMVFRKTNKYLIAQYIISEEAKDKVEIGLNSKKLLEYGFPENASLKSVPAAYALGYLIGKKIIKEKKEVPIIDFGMIRSLNKSKCYAFLKGIVDSELKIKYNEEKDLFPSQERIEGQHLKNKIELKKILEKMK